MDLQAIRYSVDGQTFTGWLADGSRGRRVPGILVGHEGPGLTGHVKARAQRLAELGYVAFAMDLYGETDPPLERAKELVRTLRADRAALRRRAAAALDVLTAHPGVDARRIAAIGYCFGGMAVLELARGGAEIACVVGFHPGLDPEPADGRAIRAKVLVCVGDKDPVVTARHRDAFVIEMAAAGVDWQLVVYGGVGHSFTNPEVDAFGIAGFAHDVVADRRSWRTMLDLFDEALGPVASSDASSGAAS